MNIKNFESFNEDLSSGPVSLDSNTLTGSTIDPNYINSGGLDISTPINMGTGKKNQFQKISAMGSNHGANTGKKLRKKPLDMKNLRDMFGKKSNKKSSEVNKPSKVMNFKDFYKSDINVVKK